MSTTKPMITNFEGLAPLMIQKYERYLPTAFDDSMTMLEKVNKIIQFLNQATDQFNGVVEQWNEVMVWVMNDGLTEAVVNRLDQFVADGTLEQIINENIFEDLNTKIDDNITQTTTNTQTIQENVTTITENVSNITSNTTNLKDRGINVKQSPFNAQGNGLGDDTIAIQSALDVSKDNNGITTIFIPKGVYNLSNTLTIYENTNLEMDEYAVLNRNADYAPFMMNYVSGSDSFAGYNGRSNIRVTGGTIQGNGGLFAGSFTTLSFVHCHNIQVENCTILNDNGAHHIELTAVQNFRCRNVKFQGYYGIDQKEAIQIDLPIDSASFPHGGVYDSTPCDNVLIDGCTFTDLSRAIGNHSGVDGHWHTNVRISNCYFENMRDQAIRLKNFKGVVIANNQIYSARRGIEIGTNQTSSSDFSITGNVIRNITEKGIWINGSTPTDMIHDVTISGNNVKNTVEEGIDITDGCTAITVTGNTVSECSNGIRLYNETKNVTITGNTFYNNSKHGVSLFTQNSHAVISNNNIMLSGQYGISISSFCSNNQITGNMVKSSQQSEGTSAKSANIAITSNSDHNNVQGNIIRSGQETLEPDYGIALDENCIENLVTNNDLYVAGTIAGINDLGTTTITTAGNRL